MNTTIDDPLLGALVGGRYRVRALVARGGMATVYTADDERLGRTVALKIIHPAQASDRRFVERFTGEAETIARLTHPNVVAVYDQGSHHGLAYLVMEYVRGRSLRELLLERQRLAPQDALAVLEQVLAAVAAAHRAGLVHRDVKPENVLVAEAPGGQTNLFDSVVKVADFGLAQAVEASADGGGHLMATAAYVAPELVAHGQADPRTDVYSAGVVLFEMLTGRVPFEAERPVEVAWQHVEREIPAPSTLAPGLSPMLDTLVGRATSRDPAGRPTDAGAMLAEVQAVRERLVTEPSTGAPYGQHTVVVPRVGPGHGATTVLPPFPGRHASGTTYGGGGGDRPSWSRLPGEAQPPQAPPHRRRQQTRSEPRLGELAGRMRTDPRARLATMAAAAALVLLGVVGIWWLGAGRYTTAPTLTNLPRAEAVAQAKQYGFGVRFGTSRYSENVAKDVVLSQDPPAGARIVSGARITLVLSKGQERYEVPDLSGKPFELAQQDLQEIRLEITQTQVYDDNVAAGSVVGTEPPAGTAVKPGDKITVQISKGRAPITMPSVVNKQLDDAKNILRQKGLTDIEVVEQENDQPKDTVISQTPADGSGVETTTKVTLTVSKGPPFIEMPEVRNRSVDEARQILSQLGLDVQVFGGGTVRFQNPDPGTHVQQGQQVRLWAF